MKRVLAANSSGKGKKPKGSTPAVGATALDNAWTALDQQGSRIGYWPQHLAGLSQAALSTLLGDVDWQQHNLAIYGRTVAQPRLVAYMADAGTPPYTYSGLQLQPSPWAQVVLDVRAAVQQLLPGTHFNSCLLNLYRDGSHHVSWHSDNERLYGRQPTIASVSFGASRDFVLRHNTDRSRKLSVSLGAGDVLVMAGATQEQWQHCIPKRRGVTQPRINLTFRTIVDSTGAQQQ